MGCDKLVFMKHDDTQGARSWSPTNDRDNPIWGWVALNYATSRVQLFQQDGSFFREVRSAQSTGSQERPEWLPLKPSPDGGLEDRQDLQQLQLLAQRLDDAEFLSAFWDMAMLATRDMSPVPDAYPGFTSPLISRPLALAHVGLSVKSDGVTSAASGDWWRLNGLVGYFPCRSDLDRETTTLPDLGLDLTTIVSRYAPDGSMSAITKSADIIITPRENGQDVYGVLLDPLVSLHRDAGENLVGELVLPQWAWQSAMEKMEAFFQSGPLIVTRDIPEEPPQRDVTQHAVVLPEDDVSARMVALPAAGAAGWDWLKPYVSVTDKAVVGGESEEALDGVLPLEGRAEDGRPRFEEGPFSGIEGYLMVRKGDKSPGS